MAPADQRAKEFASLVDWLAETYPSAHRVMDRGLVNDFTPFLKWEGKDLTLGPDLLTGHSTLPPRETAVGIISAGVAKLQSPPFLEGLIKVSADFFPGMGPYFEWLERMVFANQWVFKLILRTTIAPTMLVGSHTENVLPQQAIATVNFRIHPRDIVESVKAWVVDIIDDDRIEIASRSAGCNASPVSSTKTDGFALLFESFASVFEGVAVVPDLTLAVTNATHYLSVAKNSYRINPFVMEEEDLLRIHGMDERISLENLEKAVQFYALVMQGVQGQTGVTLQPCTLWG